MTREHISNTILVVDDEGEMRRAVVRFLSTEYKEYAVLEAENGVQALAKLSLDIALVICDVEMPEMDGFTFCQTVRSRPEHEGLPIILLTARDQEQDYEDGLIAGSTLYVPKPFDRAKLHNAIQTVIAG